MSVAALAADLSVPLQSVPFADGIVGEERIYLYTAAFMAFVSLLFLAWTLRLPEGARRYGAVVTYTAVVLTVTYVGMWQGMLRYLSLDQNAVPVSRFAGYAFGTSVLLLLAGRVGGFSRRLQAALMIPFLGITTGTLGGWFFEPPLAQVASLSSLLSFPLVAYIFLGPGASAAANTTDDRRLLYGKTRNVMLLAWLGYLVVGIVSRQNLGYLDGFAGVFLGTYIDVALYVGVGLLVLRSVTALEHTAAGKRDGEDADASRPAAEGAASETPTAAD